jgi:hypothetical protein
MQYEVRATGILSTQPIDPGMSVPWGTVVHNGVLVAYHQHIMSLRIDPELDGDASNRLVYEEAHPIPHDPKTNPHGNAYVSNRKTIPCSEGYGLDSNSNRVFMIENPQKQNPVNGKNVAYKIHDRHFNRSWRMRVRFITIEPSECQLSLFNSINSADELLSVSPTTQSTSPNSTEKNCMLAANIPIKTTAILESVHGQTAKMI